MKTWVIPASLIALAVIAGGVFAETRLDRPSPPAAGIDPVPGTIDPADLEAAMSLGRVGYASNCASCHGSSGEGDFGPALVNNELVADPELVVDTIINGFSYMPPFGDALNDAQVAAIATYIRNAWGNDFGYVSIEQAADAR
jgi:mono/diheme cytochrome c family protein